MQSNLKVRHAPARPIANRGILRGKFRKTVGPDNYFLQLNLFKNDSRQDLTLVPAWQPADVVKPRRPAKKKKADEDDDEDEVEDPRDADEY